MFARFRRDLSHLFSVIVHGEPKSEEQGQREEQAARELLQSLLKDLRRAEEDLRRLEVAPPPALDLSPWRIAACGAACLLWCAALVLILSLLTGRP